MQEYGQMRGRSSDEKRRVCVAQIIFGEKTVFIQFSRRDSLYSFIRKAILGLAASLQPTYGGVPEEEIDLREYTEFLFYVEDLGGRKILLNNREREFPNLLRFFSYKLTLHVYLTGSVADASGNVHT
ncbi:uncharacterized protein NEMAJ01_0733 [Nematocida major]|uniref:uncharacterized protein n=1 Tax=Nematocida major TaxID=1912982 RepID=UPI002008AD62|nr:uncharacterized protein NEMAJ01_0733 [Nematocida major]KAH9385837.1 hypothetical protein NEMAJ01_0733 [Nematocida major]